MLKLCQYKNILGIPKKGLHKYRFMNFAIVDVLLTFVLAYYIQYTFSKTTNYWIILFVCFLSGIFFHYIFCVETTLHKLIFN